LKMVDSVIACIAETGVTGKNIEKALALPKEHEMAPRGEFYFFHL
jgi:hypothetical protein